MAKNELTFDGILTDLRAKRYYPIYYLMGEEPYYIDLIADYIEQNILTEEEKEFNQTVVYGKDADMATIINAAKRYPMMAEHQVVIVKEAQLLYDKNDDDPMATKSKSADPYELLSLYLRHPQPSTLLVFCHKHKSLDRRKKVVGEIEKSGVLFESKALNEKLLPHFISTYLKEKKVTIEPKASAMLTEFVGTDLSRMTGELDKLIITLPTESRNITPELVERNIGISKEYNNFELKSALVRKDVAQANRIIKYFEENPKRNPLQMTLALLFSFFANLMLAYYAPEKSEAGVASMLGLKSPFAARDYVAAMQRYSGMQVMRIIGYIRYADARSKGVGGAALSDGEILRELIFRILH
jgi:DNA polymerase-3 subunit delta